MARKPKRKSNKYPIKGSHLGLGISRPFEHTFIPKTDHIYEEARESAPINNNEDNYYYEEVLVFECLECEKKFSDRTEIAKHCEQCCGNEHYFGMVYNKIKRLKYQKL